MTREIGSASESVAALVDAFHVTDKALLRARERLRKSGDAAARADFLHHVRRYFGALEREAAEHIAHVDRTLGDLYQRQYNAQAERSVACRRLERAKAVLAAVMSDPPEQALR